MVNSLSKKILTIIIAGAVALSGLSFFAGIKVGGAKKSSFGRGTFPGGAGEMTGPIADRQGNKIANRSFGGMVSGEIISKDDKSLTVKTADGGSRIVLFSSLTEIGKTAVGTLADLEIGKNVMINGKANTDGSITASVIQLRNAQPAGMIAPNGQQPDSQQTNSTPIAPIK